MQADNLAVGSTELFDDKHEARTRQCPEKLRTPPLNRDRVFVDKFLGAPAVARREHQGFPRGQSLVIHSRQSGDFEPRSFLGQLAFLDSTSDGANCSTKTPSLVWPSPIGGCGVLVVTSFLSF